jgi:hypothetical protein
MIRLGRLLVGGVGNLPPKFEFQIADCRLQIEKKEFQSAICNLKSAIRTYEADYQTSSLIAFQVVCRIY